MTAPLVLTGMFRSGTSLLSRMLDAHGRIAFAADLYQPVFKAFRNAVRRELFGDTGEDPDAPFGDYYFAPDQQELMEAIQQTSLALTVKGLPLESLREELAKYSRPFSPRVVSLLDRLRGETFAELLESGFDLVEEAYGGDGIEVTGFKVTWCTEFSPHILSHFPNARVIHLVRDPRAVSASRNVKRDAKYPWLFLARQWRKLVALAWREVNVRDAAVAGRHLLLKYEDLVAEPEPAARRICRFLDVPYDPAMTDAEGFVDGSGDPWVSNTSYAEGERSITESSVEKWRDVLEPRHVEWMELLCLPEMLAYGYEPVRVEQYAWPPEVVLNPPEAARDALAGWVSPHALLDRRRLRSEMALEHWRSALLQGRDDVIEEAKRAVCLVPEFFDEARRRVADFEGR